MDDDATLPGCVWLLALAIAACGSTLLLAPGCGGASAATRAAFATEVARCDGAIDAIVARQGTTEAEDRADLAALWAECERNLAAIGAP